MPGFSLSLSLSILTLQAAAAHPDSLELSTLPDQHLWVRQCLVRQPLQLWTLSKWKHGPSQRKGRTDGQRQAFWSPCLITEAYSLKKRSRRTCSICFSVLLSHGGDARTGGRRKLPLQADGCERCWSSPPSYVTQIRLCLQTFPARPHPTPAQSWLAAASCRLTRSFFAPVFSLYFGGGVFLKHMRLSAPQ